MDVWYLQVTKNTIKDPVKATLQILPFKHLVMVQHIEWIFIWIASYLPTLNKNITGGCTTSKVFLQDCMHNVLRYLNMNE